MGVGKRQENMEEERRQGIREQRVDMGEGWRGPERSYGRGEERGDIGKGNSGVKKGENYTL